MNVLRYECEFQDTGSIGFNYVTNLGLLCYTQGGAKNALT